MESDIIIQERLQGILPFLNERQRRIYMGAEARSLGRGGVSKISLLSGVSRQTITNGIRELESGVVEEQEYVRAKGGGRKKESDKQPGLADAVRKLVEPHNIGNSERPLIWSSKSSRKISKELENQGYYVSHEIVRQILQSLGYSSNKKTKDGGIYPERNAQFEYINAKSSEFLSKGEPVISIDCKKKEPPDRSKNTEEERQQGRTQEEENIYDLENLPEEKNVPYGTSDAAHNKGWTKADISSDTGAFVVATIRNWWNIEGKVLYPSTTRLYINADSGADNSSRDRFWKEELQGFSNESGLEIHVSHYPPGTSKWNKKELCLFAYVSQNWRGKPLEAIAVIVNLIGTTNSTTGLVAKNNVDETISEIGLKINDEKMEKM